MALLDTQKHVDALRDAGVSEGQSRAHVSVLQDALKEGVATKSDLKEVRAEMQELRAEMQAEMREIRAEMKEMRAEMQAEMREIRAEMKEMRAENKVTGAEIRNFQRMFYMGVAFMAFWGPTMIFAAQVLLK